MCGARKGAIIYEESGIPTPEIIRRTSAEEGERVPGSPWAFRYEGQPRSIQEKET